MTETIYTDLTQLGSPTPIPDSPDVAVIEKVANPQPSLPYLVRFVAPEFTTLCPMTGQPDFAHLVIDYVPGAYLVESKSLKLFLTSFRNHGGTRSGTASATCFRPDRRPAHSRSPDARSRAARSSGRAW